MNIDSNGRTCGVDCACTIGECEFPDGNPAINRRSALAAARDAVPALIARIVELERHKAGWMGIQEGTASVAKQLESALATERAKNAELREERMELWRLLEDVDARYDIADLNEELAAKIWKALWPARQDAARVLADTDGGTGDE